MTAQPITIEDIKRILRQAAGESEGVDLDGDITDERFEDLGYDSIALLEVSSRITQEYGVRIEDSAAAEADTPAALLKAVNAELGGDAAEKSLA